MIPNNVLVSGLLFGDLPGRMIKIWENGRIIPLVPREIMDEYLPRACLS